RRHVFLQLSFPSKLSEYLIVGRTVIVRRLTMLGNYCSDEALAYFEPNHPSDLGKQMLCLYRGGGLRARLSARAKVEYGPIRWEVMKQRYLKLIEGITTPTPPLAEGSYPAEATLKPR